MGVLSQYARIGPDAKRVVVPVSLPESLHQDFLAYCSKWVGTVRPFRKTGLAFRSATPGSPPIWSLRKTTSCGRAVSFMWEPVRKMSRCFMPCNRRNRLSKLSGAGCCIGRSGKYAASVTGRLGALTRTVSGPAAELGDGTCGAAGKSVWDQGSGASLSEPDPLRYKRKIPTYYREALICGWRDWYNERESLTGNTVPRFARKLILGLLTKDGVIPRLGF